MIRRLLCWFGIHDPMVRKSEAKYLSARFHYAIVCRCCGKEVSGR